MNSLKGKTALITGGSKGIGFGVALALITEGVNVVITGRNEETIQQVAQQLQEKGKDGAKAMGVAADVRSYQSQEQAVAATMEAFGGIDIVVANAGLGHFASIDELTIEQWNETIDTNLTGVFYTVKTTLSALKKSKGYLITISSLAGTNFFAKGSAYNASKFGLTGFTQAAMLDLREHEIKTTTIMPGSVATYFNNNTPDASDDWKIQQEDIGQMVVDLVKMPSRTLPSKVEVRPSFPQKKA